MKKLSYFLVAFLLIGCGGGGGGGGESTGPNPAPIVTSGSAPSVGQDSATLSGTVNPNGFSTQAWFDYGIDPGLQTHSSSPNQDVGSGVNPQTVNANLSALAPGTTYYFRLCAENSQGYSEGQIISFTTSFQGNPPTVTTIPATSVGANGATMNGNVNSNGLATNAWFEWGTDPSLSSSHTTATQVVGAGTTSQTINQEITGLIPGTIYYYRIAASNGSGTSKGSILNFTLGAVPTVKTLTATLVGPNNATLNGNVNPNGLATNAWFEWGTDPTFSSFSTTENQAIGKGTTSQTVNVTLTGLSPGTIYYFRVSAENSSGYSYGQIMSFTPGFPAASWPPNATTLAATLVGLNNATLNGKVNCNGLVTNVWFEWGTSSTLATFNSTSSQSLGSGTTSQAVNAPLSGLTSGTTYYFRVAASNSAGTSKGSIVSFTTTASVVVPTVTTNPATSVTPSGAVLNGGVNPNGAATTAWFEWGTSSTLATFNSTSSQSLGSGTTSQAVNAPLSGLTSGTTYYYRIAASNSIGTSKGSIVSFSTTSPSPFFGVVETTPANNATEIPVDNFITVTFNQEVDPSTLGNGIIASSYIGPLPGSVSYISSTKTAIFTPGTPFAPLTTYNITVATTVKSAGGEALSAPYTFSFKTVTAFWALDVALNSPYMMNVSKVAEGTHCYIYLENGRNISQTVINQIANEFDSIIYPGMQTSFGSEPNPGADGLNKVFIILMDIRDGNNPFSYVAGYFYSVNEYSNVDIYPFGRRSNQKEVLYLDILEGNPSASSFFNTLTHEFQHMIHWEQKYHQLGLSDATWLNEAMSEIAPFYVGYGPDYDSVQTFESFDNRSDSLTVWNGGLADYAVVYMWSQYMADRFPINAFKNILVSPTTGIESVESYLNANYPGETFSSVFRDWSIAVFSGNEILWTGNSEWSYKTINTWEGNYDGHYLPGLFTPDNLNTSLVPSLAPWSIDFYWYAPQSANPTFTLNLGSPPIPQASFINLLNNEYYLDLDMILGQAYAYDDAAFLILQNTSGNSTSPSTPTNLSIQSSITKIPTPMEKLITISEGLASKRLRETTGEPIGICIHDYLEEQEKILRNKIQRKQHEQ